jgi:hypothetical protein
VEDAATTVMAGREDAARGVTVMGGEATMVEATMVDATMGEATMGDVTMGEATMGDATTMGGREAVCMRTFLVIFSANELMVTVMGIVTVISRDQ